MKGKKEMPSSFQYFVEQDWVAERTDTQYLTAAALLKLTTASSCFTFGWNFLRIMVCVYINKDHKPEIIFIL